MREHQSEDDSARGGKKPRVLFSTIKRILVTIYEEINEDL
jgi:basic membrane lipoprotein Med (substrate-binding protein (PBP1-ABC) superfamily)